METFGFARSAARGLALQSAKRGLTGTYSDRRDRIEGEADDEGLTPLTPIHWAVIQHVLDHFEKTGQTPAAVRIGRAVGLGPKQLDALFPAGAVKTVFRMTGLEQPDDGFDAPVEPLGSLPS